MKYIDEYRDIELVKKLSAKIRQYTGHEISFMEVCGGHTMAIHRFGIPALLPGNIRLISGPGCPVCVSSISFIDRAIAYSKLKEVIITTYGDLLRVPGSKSSLEKEKSMGADIRVLYSSLDALKIARNNPNKKIVFLGIGFETTAPSSAIVIQKAYHENVQNFFFLSAHKIMPPVMEALLNGKVKIDGFICPGHVSTITGSEIYAFIPENYKIGCVVAGFEPTDILQSIYMLARQVESGNPGVEIQYSRAVTERGNALAQQFMADVFELKDDYWRGIGEVPASGLRLRDKYRGFDAEDYFNLDIEFGGENTDCICGNIMRGLRTPKECKLFGKVCTPLNPVGACMVSGEGSCHAYYKYRKYE
ncbi:MAG: hydrogenase formation protein HypD [Bacteroidales bacterium]|jgi:hydrogenase expression/formation protein HypD|nr:hydrogenase formation protein HypD [Bacteroidales bacterium]